jgi:hypothetical protein
MSKRRVLLLQNLKWWWFIVRPNWCSGCLTPTAQLWKMFEKFMDSLWGAMHEISICIVNLSIRTFKLSKRLSEFFFLPMRWSIFKVYGISHMLIWHPFFREAVQISIYLLRGVATVSQMFGASLHFSNFRGMWSSWCSTQVVIRTYEE